MDMLSDFALLSWVCPAIVMLAWTTMAFLVMRATLFQDVVPLLARLHPLFFMLNQNSKKLVTRASTGLYISWMVVALTPLANVLLAVLLIAICALGAYGNGRRADPESPVITGVA